MSKPRWTKGQRDAIEAKHTNLIVAAAAGSGKTTVLIERIVRLLTDPNERPDPENDLIAITFTKAAAENLKEKLARRLMELQAEDPGNRLIERLLAVLPRANICTVDSLCFRLVRENAPLLGLSPKLTLIDGTVRKTALRRAFDLALEECLDPNKSGKEEVRDMRLLYELVNPGKDDTDLEKLVFLTYDELRTYPEDLGKLNEVIDYGDFLLTDIEEDHFDLLHTPLGANVLTLISDKLSRVRARLELSAEHFPDKLVTEEVFPALFHLKDRVGRFSDALEDCDLSALCEIAREPRGPDNRKSLAGLDDYDKEVVKEGWPLYKTIFDDAKALWTELVEPFTSLEDPTREEAQRLHLQKAFIRLIQKTSAYYEAQKRAADLLDYSDVEHLALRVLQTILKQQPEHVFCRYLFVDEYQDTNLLQDEIFRLISAHGSFFYVGDVKQSIYGFRGAVPSIFLGYKNAFAPYDPDSGQTDQCVLLSDNFRSDTGVIDFVNEVFRTLMASQHGMYGPEDELRHASPDEDLGIQTELDLLCRPTASDKKELDEKEREELEDLDEHALIVQKVTELIESGEDPETIAVLAYSNRYLFALKTRMEDAGILCDYVNAESFTESSEYLYCSALLSILDNPVSEIPLVAVLTGPLFRLSSEELYRLRNFTPDEVLFDALRLYAANSADNALKDKANAFLSFWTFWRDQSRGGTVSDFLLRLIRELSLADLFAKTEEEAALCEEHLMFLYELARGYESNGIRTLSEFVAYLGTLTPDDIKFDERKTGKPVRLMTIHGAKGLEFKTCIVGELGKSARSPASFCFDPRFGLIGEYYCQEEDRRYKTLSRKLWALVENSSGKLEDLRTLYVALTRAVNRLILVACPKSLRTVFSRSGLNPLLCDGALSFLDCKSPIESILYALRDNTDLQNAVLGLDPKSPENADCDCGLFRFKILNPDLIVPVNASRAAAQRGARFPKSDAQTAMRLIDMTRELRGAQNFPSKVSVSELSHLSAQNETKKSYRLSFDRDRHSAASIGLAMHAFMQFCSFENAEKSVENEASRLVDLEFLSPDDARLLNFFSLERFFESKPYERIQKSPLVKRELRFNVFLDTSLLFGAGEGKTLLQGVIDCYFENPDGTLSIIDFKTDALDPKTGESVLLERHAKQLQLYRYALEEITQKTVTGLSLYSFSLGREISVPLPKERETASRASR